MENFEVTKENYKEQLDKHLFWNKVIEDASQGKIPVMTVTEYCKLVGRNSILFQNLLLYKLGVNFNELPKT